MRCGDDETLRAEVEHLLAHDSQADRDGFLDHPEVANRGRQATGFWPPADGRHPVAEPDVSRHPQTAPGDGTDGFSPKAAITSARWQRSEEETRCGHPIAASRAAADLRPHFRHDALAEARRTQLAPHGNPCPVRHRGRDLRRDRHPPLGSQLLPRMAPEDRAGHDRGARRPPGRLRVPCHHRSFPPRRPDHEPRRS